MFNYFVISNILCIYVTDATYYNIKMVLDSIDDIAIVVFVVEIVLKLMDDATEFWKVGWNVFDFFVVLLVRMLDTHLLY